MNSTTELIESDGILASRALLDAESSSSRDLLDRARRDGWRDALSSTYDTGFVDYVTNPSRLAFLPHLPLSPQARILEIGPGYGQMTAEIARRVASVTAIDADIAQVRFCKTRLEQEGLENVKLIAGGEDGYIPAEDQAFDGVIMNLVLEWCAIRADISNPQATQQRYLAEIERTLKLGGFFFVATKNRFSVRLLLGGRDEHMANVRFGSALPRILGRVLVKPARQRGRIHSYSKLLGMLRSARFVDIKPLLALPDARWPTGYWNAEEGLADDAARGALSAAPFKQRVALGLMPNKLVKHFAPGLVFLAYKPR
jgi:SAM-dependent methyltransferase